ncbi:MAG: hypothetical protein LIO96_03125 [Lachnospiraceae bacterium]|nr:hypothetical protein [Lachnospiraceae bacterium]
MALMNYKADQGWCNRCSNCKWIPSYRIKKTETMYICPAITKYNFNAYSGCGKLEIGYSINDGHSEVCESTQNVAYKCTLCGACDYACKVFRKDIDVSENIEELRKECVNAGYIYPQHQAIVDSIRDNGNQLCRPAGDRLDWTEGLAIKKVSEDAQGEIYFYAGDINTYSWELAKRTKAVASLLLKKGLDLITSGTAEPTAADKAFDLGFIEAGKEAAQKTGGGGKKIGSENPGDTGCPCFRGFSLVLSALRCRAWSRSAAYYRTSGTHVPGRNDSSGQGGRVESNLPGSLQSGTPQ